MMKTDMIRLASEMKSFALEQPAFGLRNLKPIGPEFSREFMFKGHKIRAQVSRTKIGSKPPLFHLSLFSDPELSEDIVKELKISFFGVRDIIEVPSILHGKKCRQFLCSVEGEVKKDDGNVAITEDGFIDLLKNIPEGTGLYQVMLGGDNVISKFSIDDLIKLGKDESLFHIIISMARKGGAEFAHRLEFGSFPPNTELSNQMQFRWFKWKFPYPWNIISIPIEKREAAEKAAEESGMRIADGIPFLVGPMMASHRPEKLKDIKDINWFPMNGTTVYTLEGNKPSEIPSVQSQDSKYYFGE